LDGKITLPSSCQLLSSSKNCDNKIIRQHVKFN
jgi:hypothetical protein